MKYLITEHGELVNKRETIQQGKPDRDVDLLLCTFYCLISNMYLLPFSFWEFISVSYNVLVRFKITGKRWEERKGERRKDVTCLNPVLQVTGRLVT